MSRDLALMHQSGVSRATIKWAIKNFAWYWTEGPARKYKYIGCPFWSLRALQVLRENGWENAKGVVVHEHIVPREVVAARVLQVLESALNRVRDAMDTYCIGCVILKDEDHRLRQKGLRSTMPESFAAAEAPGHDDIWGRYTAAGIEWRDLSDCWGRTSDETQEVQIRKACDRVFRRVP